MFEMPAAAGSSSNVWKEAIDIPLGHSDEPFGPLLADCPKRRPQRCANRLGRRTVLEPHQRSEPTPVPMGDPGMHHHGNEDIGSRSGSGAGNGCRGNADAFEKATCSP